jgi:ABC-type antimicrobial peptide transport system permease subunit
MDQQRHVVLINQALARIYFPGQNPIGRKLTIIMKDDNVPTEIVGVVGDVKNERLDEPADPSVYWPHPELAYTFMTIVARTDGDALAIAPSAVAAVHAIRADQPVADIRTMKSWLGDSTASAQFTTTLLVILAVVALALAATGIFGVMSHAVVQRTREMGIRMALGARSADVTAMILKEGARILLIGSLIGCAIALALTRFMKSILYETNSMDPLSLLGVTVLLVAAGLIACWIPSRRAARVNPIEALRYE